MQFTIDVLLDALEDIGFFLGQTDQGANQSAWNAALANLEGAETQLRGIVDCARKPMPASESRRAAPPFPCPPSA